MTNYCSSGKVKGCPASFYTNCPAYLSGRNCWEVELRPCCRVEKIAKCIGCPVFARARAAARSKL